MIQLGILFLWIKPLRALLLPDAIGQVKIIAQTQFTGYPYWFDSIAYFSMITTPFWGAIVGKYIQKRVQR